MFAKENSALRGIERWLYIFRINILYIQYTRNAGVCKRAGILKDSLRPCRIIREFHVRARGASLWRIYLTADRFTFVTIDLMSR